MKTSLFGLLMLAFCSLQGQDLTTLVNRQDSIKYLTHLIQKDGWVESFGTGPAGIPSKQYFRFTFLLTLMDTKDLIVLVKNSAGALRVYGYMGLHQKNYEKLNQVEQSLACDTTMIPTVSGCVVENYSVAQAINEITKWYWQYQTVQLLDAFKEKRFREQYFKWMTSHD